MQIPLRIRHFETVARVALHRAPEQPVVLHGYLSQQLVPDPIPVPGLPLEWFAGGGR